MRVIIGIKSDRIDVSLKETTAVKRRHFIPNEGLPFGGGASFNNITTELIPIDSDYFLDLQREFAALWSFIGNKHLSKMESRIFSAALWVGRSLAEANQINSFLYLIIALESLFSYDAQSMFRESIGQSLADAVSFLLGDCLEERLEINKKIKEYYKIRSGIVHSGGSKVSFQSYRELLNYVTQGIRVLLTTNEFKSMTSYDHFVEFIRNRKYS